MLINKKSKSTGKTNPRKTSKSPVAKSKSQTITKTALKEAYNLVINDLFNAFLKAQDGQSIRLDNQAYRFYKMGFRMSNTLKKALDQQLS